MRKLLLGLLVIVSASLQLSAQITRVEYFFDADPGFGNGITASITSATNISDLNININTASLSAGLHTLYIRSLDAGGKWSVTSQQNFVKTVSTTANITAIEYFFDTDPGFGNGIQVTITPNTNIADFTINANTASLSDGIHTMYLRTKDANGTWSITNQYNFVKVNTSISNIVRIEYFIDTDPGFGNATPLTFTQADNVADLNFTIDPSGLSDGLHRLFIRSLDASGKWSVTNATNLFLVGPYTFIGNGSWTTAANWMYNLVPVTPIVNGVKVIIDHIAGGQATFTGNIVIQQGQLIVQPGKKLTVTGTITQ